MQEYIENGTRLGWLINVEAKQVEIYRPRKDVKTLENPTTPPTVKMFYQDSYWI